MCSTGQLARKYPSFPLPAEQSARRKNVAATFVKSKKTYTFATASETDDALFMIVHILAEIAQLVEHNLAKVGVASSSLVFRSEGCSNGGIGRHEGLKIPWPLRLCGFKSRFEYEESLLID